MKTSPRARNPFQVGATGLVLLSVVISACDRRSPAPPQNLPTSSQPSANQSPPDPKAITAPSKNAGPDLTAAPRALTPLSEYQGRIRRIVLQIPEIQLAQAWTPLRDLISATTSQIAFTLICDSPKAMSDLREHLKQIGNSDETNITLPLFERPMLIWARDRYISCTGAAQTPDALPVWLVPQTLQNADTLRRAGEREIPACLNRNGPLCRIAETPLILEGGNVLATPKHVLIGRNAIPENAAMGSPDQIGAELARTFRQRVFLIHDDTGLPPIKHIDMLITVVGDNDIIVASPSLAAEVIANADAASRKALDERLFITPDMPDPKGPDFSAPRAARFDQISRQLEQAGYRVTRIPYADSRGGAFAVTYNNVLQETIDGQHVVYMPIYQIPALDQAAAQIYEKLGFKVKPIDVSPICHLLGAIRCMANVVERN